MLKMLRRGLVLLISLLVFCSAAKGAAKEGRVRLVSPELLEASKLKIIWQNKLPIRKTESLERLLIIDNRIYALSDRNYMVSLNRENGNVVFSRSVSKAGFPVVGLELYKGELFSVIGNKLVEISPESGTERRAKHLEVSVTCPAARNSSYFYVVGADRRMHTLRAEDKIQVFEVAAENDSRITSVVADENLVVFATDGGACVSIRPHAPKRLWQFDAADSIVEPIVRDEDSLFFASKDTNVYRLDILTGRFVWKYQAGAVLNKGPRVTREVVYQCVGNKGLAAIDKSSGKALWQLAENADLLARTSGKSYVITKDGKLVVMDDNKAKQLYSVNFAGVSRYATNVEDSKIYIADKSGRIACLEPVE